MKKRVEVEIIKGDISTALGALVVPQYPNKCSLTGVSGEILHTKNYDGVLQYDTIVSTKEVPYGYALITEGADNMLINVAVLNVDKNKAFNVVQLATYSALKAAEENGIAEIAIPALGTGIDGELSFGQSSNAIMSAIHSYVPQGVLQKVVVYIFNWDKHYKLFELNYKRNKYQQYVDRQLEEQYQAIVKHNH